MCQPASDAFDCTDLVTLLRTRAATSSPQGFIFEERAGQTWLTFADLDRRARAVGRLLQATYPAAKSCLLCYPPGVDFLVGFFGSLYAGLTAVPAYPPRARRADSRLEAIAGDSPNAIVLTNQDLLQEKERLAVQTPRLRVLPWVETCTATDPLSWEPSSFPTDRPVVLQYTSGSTALPKGVMLTHGCILHNLRRMREILGLGPDTPGVCWLPAFHDMGLIGNLLQTVYSGSTLTILSPPAVAQDPLFWLQTITKYRAYVSGGPGFIFQHCLDRIKPAERAALDLSSWRVAYVGAEPVSAAVLSRFTEAFIPHGFRPETFFPTYGLAEGTLMTTGGDRAQPPVVRSFLASSLLTRKPIQVEEGRPLVACGYPVPDLELCIIDPEKRIPVAPGKIGEIWVAGPSVAAGYWNRPEESAHTFEAQRADGCTTKYLRTGDLGFMPDQLFISGRIKELIIIRGRNYYPQDLEDVVGDVSPLLGYHRGAAFTVDEGDRPRLILVHEVVRAFKADQGDALFDKARQVLAENFDVELSELTLVRTGSLPRSTSGKVQRVEACQRFQAGTLDVVATYRAANSQPAEASPGDDGSPRMVSEAAIRDWLKARVGRQLNRSAETIDVEQPFASFGLDSVSMVTIAADLEKWLQRQLSQTLLYDAPTIARLAQNLAPEVEAPKVAATLKNDALMPIAVIGMGCRFPEAHGPEQFWQLLRAGRHVIHDVSAERWFSMPSEKCARQGGFLDDVQGFDAAFFGITPREAVYLDPQHRLLLETAWESCEHAGLVPGRLAGTEVGVFVGIANNDYGRLLVAGGAPPDAYIASGNALSMAAHRLSYHFDLRGPSMAVDTACSSSLVAVHLACQALRAGECGLALAGGVNLILSGDVSANLAQAQMLSPTGRCQTFDAAADGYVRGEGCGLVVLKPLTDALRDGDPIYAILEGSAVNQDGRSNGITAPNQTAQVEVIRKALRQAQRQPSDISYVELHGTGTPLGDPIEFEALAATLGSVQEPCALGAVKTNLGHLESAAGIASLIKTVLQLHHGELVPHPHLGKINPLIPLAGSRFRVPKTTESWPDRGAPRRAGVSSFGFGGTNAHVIVAQPPTTLPVLSEDAGQYILPLSAQTAPALRQLAGQYAGWLVTHENLPLLDICATAAHRRTHFAKRLAIVGQNHEDVAAALRRMAFGPLEEKSVRNLRDRVAFMFTGQGAQYAGLGKKLAALSPIFREHLQNCAAILRSMCNWSLIDVLEDETRLARTDFAQPAIFALEYALARTWQAWGMEPSAVLGHSVGEYVAACIAGVFSLEDGLRLVVERGRGMQACPEGTMLACFASLARIQDNMGPWQDRLEVAAFNGPESVVVSGDCQSVREFQTSLTEHGIACKDLRVGRAFHSRLMEPALDGLKKVASSIISRHPKLRLISNLTGDFHSAPIDAGYWVRQSRQTVRFADGMLKLYEAGITHFLEIGPAPILTRLGQTCLPAKDVVWLDTISRQNQVNALHSLARLYEDGADVRWDAVLAPRPVVPAPTYPFQPHQFWFQGSPRFTVETPLPAPADAPLEWLPLSNWQQPLPRMSTGLEKLSGGLAQALVPLALTREDRYQLDQFAQAQRHFDKLAADYVVKALRELGWQAKAGNPFVVEEIAVRHGVLPKHRRLFERLLAIAAEEGWLELQQGSARVINLPALHDFAERQALFVSQFPEFAVDFQLVHRCGSNLAKVLRGDEDPLHVLFGDEAAGLVERMYERSPVAAFYNDQVRRSVAQILAIWPGDRPLRILELGAGTGGTTAHLLPLFEGRQVEYVFTDVSPLFLAQARDKFKKFDCLQYRILDIENSPADQGFADGQFDFVLAANVLHATSDLRCGLGNIRKLLAPTGLLVLLEGTRPTRLLDLVFGLSEGWWKFTDTALRPDYPLLSPNRWAKLLQEEKYKDPVLLPVGADDIELDQAVILASAPGPSPTGPLHQRNGHSGKNGKSQKILDWLVVEEVASSNADNVAPHSKNDSSLVPLLVHWLRSHGERAHVLPAGTPVSSHDFPEAGNVRAVVFGGGIAGAIRAHASFTWMVTEGKAPFHRRAAGDDLWSREHLTRLESNTCLVDLDPTQSLDRRAQCLFAALRYPDDQPAVVYRGDQRYVPRSPASPSNKAATKSASWTRTDLEALPMNRRRSWLAKHLLAEFSGIAGLDLTPAEMDKPLHTLGLDSLMALQFRNRLDANLGIILSVVDFLKGLSLNQLIENVLQQVAVAGATPSKPLPAKDLTPAIVPDSLDKLSERELDRLLQALLE